MSATENVIEFLRGSETMTVTLSSGRFMGLIKKLAKRFPDQVEIIHDKDESGYFLAHLPVSFLTFRGSLQLTEEQRAAKREALKKLRSSSGNFDESRAEDMLDEESII